MLTFWIALTAVLLAAWHAFLFGKDQRYKAVLKEYREDLEAVRKLREAGLL